MIKFLPLVIFSTLIMGQENFEKQNPCYHPLIKLAKEKGLKSIPIKDFIKFRRLVKACEESGNSKIIEQLELMDWERDYKRSKSMSSWTSTHAMFVFVSVGYYYMAKILDIPYNVTFFPKNK